MRLAALPLVLALAAPARADGLVLEAGVGAPAGLSAGAGVRAWHWQLVAEGGGAGAAFVGMLSVSMHLHRDVWWGDRDTVAAGASATRLGYIAGSDEVTSGTIDTIGPTLEWRHRGAGRAELVVDAGAMIGRCRGDCNATFVMPMIAVRLAYPL